MAKDTALLAEVHRLVSQRMESGQIVQPNHIVDLLLESRPIEGEHAHFYRICARRDLIKTVTRLMRNVGMSDDPAPLQLAFPGHTRLVKSYPVMRSGERALVPIALCTRKELKDHILLLRKQATGCENHALELEGYVAAREEAEESLVTNDEKSALETA